MRTAYSAMLAVLIAVAAVPAWAHHEIAGYDLEHPVVVDGVVREFVWANPHVVLYLEVPNAASTGEVEWALEGGSVQALARNGWTRQSLRPGDRVAVLLAPKLGTERNGQILRVTASDGRVLSISRGPAGSR